MSKRGILILALLLVILLALLDYISGAEIAFSFFYLFPIALVTWYVGRPAGNLVAVISILAWLLSNKLAGEAYTNELIRYWNAVIRLVFFVLVNYLLHQLRNALDRVTQLSQTDFTTGMLNGREFYRLSEMEILRSRRYGHSFAMLFIDLDNFKQVNDTYGHLAGDEVLQTVARRIKASLRRTDLAARIGGDEFGILLPESDQGMVSTVVEKIQSSLRNLDLLDHRGVTVSIGCVVFRQPPENVDQIIQQADELMYEVKNRGKDNALIVES